MAHPRVGGENDETPLEAVSAAGSSPRGRGKRLVLRPRRLLNGLIPAWAGKTRTATRNRPRAPAHPRVGGENLRRHDGHTHVEGSSPRGRGKRLVVLRPVHQERLIPAWAGKTVPAVSSMNAAKAHPRVGGENLLCGVMFRSMVGSSPRGRGKPRGDPRRGRVRRLIPAWAGKTRGRPAVSLVFRAHPRVGGENGKLDDAKHTLTGSSPRGRGKLAIGDRLRLVRGLIPAWAGKTS